VNSPVHAFGSLGGTPLFMEGDPVAIAAGIISLTICLQKGFYEPQQEKTEKFVIFINSYSKQKNILIEHCRLLLYDLLELRIYLGPLWHEVGFISSAHSNEE
jgi:glutamate-1-semialdehyde aminotransferase